MSFDGNGNWTSDYYPQSGELIKASDFNNVFTADIGNGFGNCVTRDGQGIMQTDFNANNYRVINVADPINAKDAVNYITLTTGDLTLSGNLTFTGNVEFSGDLTAETQDPSDNSTKVATTAYVQSRVCTEAATTTSTASANAPAYVVENYKNDTDWYRVWSDGWIEQGGYVGSNTTVTFLKPFADTNYNIILTDKGYQNNGSEKTLISSFDATTMSLYSQAQTGCFWRCCGY